MYDVSYSFLQMHMHQEVCWLTKVFNTIHKINVYMSIKTACAMFDAIFHVANLDHKTYIHTKQSGLHIRYLATID